MNDVVPLLKHNPSAQRPEILEAITVQREPLIAALVESALDTSGGLRHHLLIGPRGIGKTHILSLVASRVRTADPDSRQVVLGSLDEDPWPIRTYGKFLAAIATRVAEATGDSDLGRAANVLRAATDDDALRGEDLVRRAIGERRLVLLVENLDEIFRRIGTDGQLRFRAFAEDWGRMLVLATTPQLFAGVRRHDAPFYGFFAVTHLDELSLESAADLLKRVATLRGDEELLRFLASDVAMRRLRAIEALAGGHPRVWLLLAGCISVAAVDELVPLFLEALDQLTPYYQDRLRELSDPQQEVVVLLSESGGALSNRELSERSGIPERQIATILKQLADRGYVRRARLPEDLSVGDRRMSFWELREPLMRLCLDVKQARGEPLRIVVEFLRAWYGTRLLDELNRLPPAARLANEYASEAFRTLDGVLLEEDLMRGSAEEILARAERGLSLRPNDETLKNTKAVALLMLGRPEESLALLTALVASASSPGRATVAGLQLAFVRLELGEQIDVGRLLADAVEFQRQQPDSAAAAVALARAYEVVDNHAERALEWYARAVDLEPNNAKLQYLRGVVFEGQGSHDEAVEAFARAVDLEPGVADYHYRHGEALVSSNRFQEAVASLRRAVELEPSNSLYQARLGYELLRDEKYEDALGPCEVAVTLDPRSAACRVLYGIALEAQGLDDDALQAYRRAVELEPESVLPLVQLATMLCKLDEPVEAEALTRRAIRLDGDDPDPRFVLVEAILAQGAVERALAALHGALVAWDRSRHLPPGDTASMCTIVWTRYGAGAERAHLIRQLVEAYHSVGALDEIGRGVVATIRTLLDEDVSQHDVDAWVDEWAQAPFASYDIPLRVLEAARAWKRDRDQAHLLTLPLEQREILMGMLPRQP